MGTRSGHHPVAPAGGRSGPARHGALQNWVACVRRRTVPAGRHTGALTSHAPHRPWSRAAPMARQLRRAVGRVGSICRRQPTGPTPPGRRRRVPVGHAGAPPHRVPHILGNPTQGHRPAWDDLIAAFHDHGVLPTTPGRRSGRRRSAKTTGAASAPAYWSSETPSARSGTTSLSAISAPGHRAPTSHTPATSAGNETQCPPQRQRAPTGARSAPTWPRGPGQNPPRARTAARKRRPCTGASGEHTPPHTNARAPRAPSSCWSTCTCGTPRLSLSCRMCSRPDPHPPPRFTKPAASCLADGGRGWSTPEPAAGLRRQPSGA